MHCVLAMGLSWAENHESLNCTAGAFQAACSQGWAGNRGGSVVGVGDERKLQHGLNIGAGLMYLMWLKCMLWIDDVLCGETRIATFAEKELQVFRSPGSSLFPPPLQVFPQLQVWSLQKPVVLPAFLCGCVSCHPIFC